MGLDNYEMIMDDTGQQKKTSFYGSVAGHFFDPLQAKLPPSPWPDSLVFRAFAMAICWKKLKPWDTAICLDGQGPRTPISQPKTPLH